MDLSLAELTPDNLGAAVALPPPMGPPVPGYPVAPVVASVAEAYVNPTAWPRVILDGARVVGFVMANWDPDNELEAFRAGIWRMNVADEARGRGVGSYAVEQVVAEARRRGVARITVLWEPGPEGPQEFYLKTGFVPTGEELFGQVVGARDV